MDNNAKSCSSLLLLSDEPIAVYIPTEISVSFRLARCAHDIVSINRSTVLNPSRRIHKNDVDVGRFNFDGDKFCIHTAALVGVSAVVTNTNYIDIHNCTVKMQKLIPLYSTSLCVLRFNFISCVLATVSTYSANSWLAVLCSHSTRTLPKLLCYIFVFLRTSTDTSTAWLVFPCTKTHLGQPALRSRNGFRSGYWSARSSPQLECRHASCISEDIETGRFHTTDYSWRVGLYLPRQSPRQIFMYLTLDRNSDQSGIAPQEHFRKVNTFWQSSNDCEKSSSKWMLSRPYIKYIQFENNGTTIW